MQFAGHALFQLQSPQRPLSSPYQWPAHLISQPRWAVTYSRHCVSGVPRTRIAQHMRHMEKEPKDTQAKRRLTMLLSHRNRVLKYLRRDNRQTYERVLEVEGIRKTGMFDPAYRKRPTKRPTKRGLVEARKRAQKKVVKLAKAQEKKRKKKRPS